MKLTEELKKKIDAYFESKSAEEVKDILKGYDIEVSPKENIEERPIGNVFEFEGTKLKVVKTIHCLCNGCYFSENDRCNINTPKIAGICDKEDRKDKNFVIFIKV